MKTFLWILALAAVGFGCFKLGSCNAPSVKIVHDTTYTKSVTTTPSYTPKPVRVDTPQSGTSPVWSSEPINKTNWLKKYMKIIHDTVIGGSSVRFYNPPTTNHSVMRLPDKIDTEAVITDYYSRRIYSDTSKLKYGYIVIHDTVTRNEIRGRSIMTEITYPNIYTTQTVTDQPKYKLFAGMDIGYGVGVSAALLTKGDHLIGAGYMLTDHGGILDLSYKWKISLFK